MRTLRIYLADLTHVGNGIATESFPLNVGLIASHAKKAYGNEVDIRLFKYPDDLREALLQQPPDILGCSNYAWNSDLSYYFCRRIKAVNRDILTVWGGPNYPFEAAREKQFLEERPDLDIHVFYEGEEAFSGLVGRVLSVSRCLDILKDPIPGCQFFDHGSGQFLNGPPLPRPRDLDAIPSPYVIGLLDKFFDGRLTPIVQTERGCPFKCNFCNAAEAYFNKVYLFSDDYVREELTYIAEHAAKVGVSHLTFADNNFGMHPRDAVTSNLLQELREKYGWPRSLSVTIGKNNKERIIDATKPISQMISIGMSVQSMDESVLKNIKRKNIKIDHYRAVVSAMNEEGRHNHADVILALPGETLASFIRGLSELLDSGVRQMIGHTLQMNHGTPYRDDEEYRKREGFVTKYRLVPLDFSRIGDDYIFDVEEVAVATNTLSFEEYVEARKYLFVIDLCCNSVVFEPLRKYLTSRQLRISEWISRIYEGAGEYLPEVKQVFDSFENETVSELWDTKEALVNFYSRPDNYEKLLSYERGGNVLFKHRVWMLSRANEQWVESVFRCTEGMVGGDAGTDEEGVVRRELAALKDYIVSSVINSFCPEKFDTAVEKCFDYDILTWLKKPGHERLSDFAVPSPARIKFHLTTDSITIMRDAFKRYGTSIAGLTKLVQRVRAVHLARRAAYVDE